ncbi:MAG: DUF3553 domain-containing protein [Vicinamibacterales bacterium]
MEKGKWVRHRARPLWGAGQVIASDGAYWAIEFEDGTKFKIGVAGASHHLEPSEPGTLKPKPAKSTTKTPCAHCVGSLGKSVYAREGTLRSCPKCSTRDGHEHVYYDYPGGFGTEAKVNGKEPTGVKSHCRACRFKEALRPRARCADLKVAVVTTEEQPAPIVEVALET